MVYTVVDNTIFFVKDFKGTISIKVSKGTVEFIDCEISEGVQITVSAVVRIRKCVIKDNCTIGSNISFCKYENKRLVITHNQQHHFKFNHILISGGIRSISMLNNSCSLIFENADVAVVNIIVKTIGVINNGNIIIKNNDKFSIKSFGKIGILCQTGSRLIISNTAPLSLHLNGKGIVSSGETNIICKQHSLIFESTGYESELWLYKGLSNWRNTTSLGIGDSKVFRRIEIRIFAHEFLELFDAKIELDESHEYFYPLRIKENRIENLTRINQTLLRRKIKNKLGKVLISNHGTVVLNSLSSIECPTKLVIDENSSLRVSESTTISNSVIKDSNVNLNSSKIENSIIVNSDVIVSEDLNDSIVKEIHEFVPEESDY